MITPGQPFQCMVKGHVKDNHWVVEIVGEKPPLRSVTFTNQTKPGIGDKVYVTPQRLSESGLHVIALYDCVM